jgi:hypothetical protein
MTVLLLDSFERVRDIILTANVHLNRGRSVGAKSNRQLVRPNYVFVEYDQRPTGTHHFG